MAINGDPSAMELLKSKVLEAESKLPNKDAFTAETEKQYEVVFQTYFRLLGALTKIKTSEALQFRNASFARVKTKYEGAYYGPNLSDAYSDMVKREHEKEIH